MPSVTSFVWVWTHTHIHVSHNSPPPSPAVVVTFFQVFGSAGESFLGFLLQRWRCDLSWVPLRAEMLEPVGDLCLLERGIFHKLQAGAQQVSALLCLGKIGFESACQIKTKQIISSCSSIIRFSWVSPFEVDWLHTVNIHTALWWCYFPKSIIICFWAIKAYKDGKLYNQFEYPNSETFCLQSHHPILCSHDDAEPFSLCVSPLTTRSSPSAAIQYWFLTVMKSKLQLLKTLSVQLSLMSDQIWNASQFLWRTSTSFYNLLPLILLSLFSTLCQQSFVGN